jgi:hypothetical protein
MVALALASVPLAWWLDILSIQWLYVVGFAMGSGYVIGGGAEQVYLTFLVGREGLIAAQAQFAATESASRLLGPGIAGALVQMLGAPLAILCNVYRVDLEPAPHRRAGTATGAAADPSRAQEIREGLAFVWNHPLLRTLAWTSGFWQPRPRRRRMPWSCSGSTAAPCFSSCPTPRCGSGVTPDPMMGRMVATMRCITMAAAPLGALAAGALAEHFSVRTGLACIAAGALALAVATVSGSRLRAVKD